MFADIKIRKSFREKLRECYRFKLETVPIDTD